ncbi:MAG: hypothetical protein Q7T18_05455, partial [Sedimentisphaerales bacterium]|nr:hypothetical protein [Sedimentisphaerales bacterium]
SAAIRTSMMDLAGKIGGPNDLVWLTKITTNGDGEAAWRAEMEIFKRSNSALLAEWISRFDADAGAKLTPDRKAALLEMTEQKAVAENNSEILVAVRKRLADAYGEKGQFDKAAQYYGMLVETASGADRESLLVGLLDVRLRARQFDAAVQIVANRLLEKDLDSNDVFVKKIDGYLAQPANKTDASALVKSLGGIGGVESKLRWQWHLLQWRTTFEQNQPLPVASAPDPNKTAAAVLPQGKN